jgi:hypothetical protein
MHVNKEKIDAIARICTLTINFFDVVQMNNVYFIYCSLVISRLVIQISGRRTGVHYFSSVVSIEDVGVGFSRTRHPHPHPQSILLEMIVGIVLMIKMKIRMTLIFHVQHCNDIVFSILSMNYGPMSCRSIDRQ